MSNIRAIDLELHQHILQQNAALDERRDYFTREIARLTELALSADDHRISDAYESKAEDMRLQLAALDD